MVRDNFPFPEFQQEQSLKQCVWDLVSAAVVIAPDIITEYKDIRIDIDDNPDSPTYGKSFETDDVLRQKVRVPLSIDQARFWDILKAGISKFYRLASSSTQASIAFNCSSIEVRSLYWARVRTRLCSGYLIL